jgi:NAD(P)-dependent dehydrogenase (short-subunit alcohol dehydrogenase family)
VSGRLDGRFALITGASRGIGRAAGLALAREGAHVILLARTVGGLEEADDEIRAAGGSATLVPLDLKDFDALDRLGASIHERWGKLDIFIANAGRLGPLSPLGHVTPKDWGEVIDVNLTANWRLIRSLDPLLKRSDAGRVVFLSSDVAREPHAYWGPYAVTKAGLEMLALTYAAECVKSAVKVNILDPGIKRTKMRAEAMPGEDPLTLEPPEVLGPLFVELCDPACRRHGERIEG